MLGTEEMFTEGMKRLSGTSFAASPLTSKEFPPLETGLQPSLQPEAGRLLLLGQAFSGDPVALPQGDTHPPTGEARSARTRR